MDAIIGDYLGQTSLAGAQIHANLTVFPLLADTPAHANYLTLDEALDRQLLEITEVSKDGSVPQLLLKNPSRHQVLILDGEELIGAKQNRIVNTTILVDAWAQLEIPVSCVEQNRWHYRSDRFSTGKRMLYAGLRAQKADQVHACIRGGGGFEADQGSIWSDIEMRSVRSGTVSRTGAMADMYEQQDAKLQGYLDAFTALETQLGAVFAMDGKVVGVEGFDCHETFDKVLPKLVQSYALDALDSPKHATRTRHVPDASAQRFLEAIANARLERRESVGCGTDLRLASRTLTGLGLAADGRLLHLSAFRRATPNPSPMARFSRRRMID